MKPSTLLTIMRHPSGSPIPYQLLLLADPSRSAINQYISTGVLYQAYVANSVIGCYVLELDEQAAEIKNIAVAEAHQGQGVGTALLRDAEARARTRQMRQIVIRTGDSSIRQQRLYQQLGFRITKVEKDYFTKNYPDPIIEDGMICQDRVTLAKLL